MKIATLYRCQKQLLADQKKYVRSYTTGRKAYNGLIAHFRNWPNGIAFLSGHVMPFRSMDEVEDHFFFICDDE
jgi:hypothetical protein